MRKFLLGMVLLAVLFGLGIWVTRYADTAHTPISEALAQAAEESLAGNWETGIALGEKAKALWDENWHKVAAIADHAPMDEIDGLFAQLKIYGDTDLRADFAACCARLCKLVQAIAEAHAPSWWNLL